MRFDTALKNKIIVGAYHEYDISSKGETQAIHFTETYRSKATDVLPPMVKLFFEDETISDAKAKELDTELVTFLKYLYNKYDKKTTRVGDTVAWQPSVRR